MISVYSIPNLKPGTLRNLSNVVISLVNRAIILEVQDADAV